MTDIEDDDWQPVEPKVLNPPKEIWLSYGEIDEVAEHEALLQSGEVSWCYHEVDSTDVRYVLASELEAVKAERDRLAKFAQDAIDVCEAESRGYLNAFTRNDYCSCDDARAAVCEGLADLFRKMLDSEGKPVGEWAKQETT